MDIGLVLTKILTLATLAGNLFTVGLVIFYFIRRSIFESSMSLLGAHARLLGTLISAGATVGSLVYSEVIGFIPCILCWIQRLFMYPMMFLFGLAMWRREDVIFPYTLFLSLLGGAVSLYHWIKNMLLLYTHSDIPCPAVSNLPACDKIDVLQLGYITIPMIALNAFILLGIVSWAAIRSRRQTSVA